MKDRDSMIGDSTAYFDNCVECLLESLHDLHDSFKNNSFSGTGVVCSNEIMFTIKLCLINRFNLLSKNMVHDILSGRLTQALNVCHEIEDLLELCKVEALIK